MRRLLIAVVLCLVATGASAEIPDNLGEHLTKGYIRPSTAQFAASAAATSGALDRLCQSPDEARLQTVRQRFDDLVDAWFRIFFLRFGPMVATNRFERIFFWPDPRGVILRQVGEVLGERDPEAIDPAKLAAKSVAVQGLPALEYVLFGSGSDALLEETEEGRYRCAYALSISIAIAETAAEVANEWSENGDFAKDFSRPEAENRLYRSQKEVAAEAVKALAGGMTYLSDVVISPFLGKEPEQARSKRAPLWRSDSTIRAIRSGVEALEEFYIATGFSESLSETDRWVDGSLQLEMRNVLATLDKLNMPFEEAVKPGPGREALVYTVIALKSLHTTLDTRLAQAVGVSVGFNALDGD
jgi:predicted lipoprotein